MNERPPESPPERDLAFFGKVGADVSHDMRNVLSVINEYAGLLDDLIAGASRWRKLDHEKLRKLAESITRQVKRGTELMERLSRFSHTTDTPTASFDLAALAANVASLAQRRAKLAGCRLESELPEQPVNLTSNPFGVQHALFLAIEVVTGAVEKGETLALRLAAEGDSAVVTVSGPSPGLPAERDRSLEPLSELMSDLGGSVEASCENGVLSIVLTFRSR
jgi:signal transduction histidine kinase